MANKIILTLAFHRFVECFYLNQFNWFDLNQHLKNQSNYINLNQIFIALLFIEFYFS